MKHVPLGDVATINPRGTKVALDESVSFVGMAELDAESAAARPLETRPFRDVSKGYTIFRDHDLLVAKITPCWENQKIGQAKLNWPIGVGSTEFHVVRPGPELHDRYALHFLRQDSVKRAGELRMTGSGGQRRVPALFINELQVPLPTVEEQRRIASILDHADALRTKRRQALAKLDSLTQSIFHQMFSRNSTYDVLAGTLMPYMRNGLSPSSTGDQSASVLTLSAVTQGRFDPNAQKDGKFKVVPPSDKTVSMQDLLICRGNGNKDLVGTAVFAYQDFPDLVFPDTVIAGRVDSNLVTLPYLWMAWKQRGVRDQIESLARTTNGTYKINQAAVASVKVPLPPLELQQEFSSQFMSVRALRKKEELAFATESDLFASLQSRAFRGEL